MKYQAPPGGAADAPYVDGNRSAGTKGSVVPAAAIEHHQRELAHLIAYSGQVPAANDLEQVRKAIQLLIEAATGGGVVETYLLLAQASARLPIFPEIQTADGRMNVMSPGTGSILVPATVPCLHRGIAPFNTSDYDEAARTFETAGNKTYHLRWTPADGFILKDVVNAGYNPDVAAETAAKFDTGYDDMLVARVVTNSSNVATITNLKNRNRLCLQTGGAGAMIDPSTNDARALFNLTWNFARTPTMWSFSLSKLSYDNNQPTRDHDVVIWSPGSYPGGELDDLPITRYGSKFEYQSDFTNLLSLSVSVEA